MINFAIDGTTLAWSIFGLSLAVLGFIIFMKRFFARNTDGNLAEKYAQLTTSIRAKYPEADVFRARSTFFNLALALAVGTVTLAFSWTQYEKPVVIYELEPLDEDIEVAPIRTATPPPPPPPPPPPVIEQVPDDEILEEEEPEFVDEFIDEDTEVFAEPVVKNTPPPPPPPPEEEPAAPELPFIIVEQMPRFPGCEDMAGTKKEKEKCAERKMLEFIYKNIKYPAIARENDVEGTCVIGFVINEEGAITDAKIVRDIGAKCGEEALRVIKLMNSMPQKWTPGKQRGRKVKVQFNMPIRFKLQ